jgi:hypothetical protein
MRWQHPNNTARRASAASRATNLTEHARKRIRLQVKKIARSAYGSPPSPSGRRDGDEGMISPLTLYPLPVGEGK